MEAVDAELIWHQHRIVEPDAVGAVVEFVAVCFHRFLAVLNSPKRWRLGAETSRILLAQKDWCVVQARTGVARQVHGRGDSARPRKEWTLKILVRSDFLAVVKLALHDAEFGVERAPDGATPASGVEPV